VPSAYEPFVREARLPDLPGLSKTILKGGIAGRVIINPRDPVVS
jgi:acrylyl-CoA reductase (NADPH)